MKCRKRARLSGIVDEMLKTFGAVGLEVLAHLIKGMMVKVLSLLIGAIASLYIAAKSQERLNNKFSNEFGVNVGVHQGSILSSLLFILVLKALSRELRTSVPWELLYADDLVLISKSLDYCLSKFKK